MNLINRCEERKYKNTLMNPMNIKLKKNLREL